MKKVIALLTLMLFVLLAYGQRVNISGPIHLEGTLKSDLENFKVGSPVSILSLTKMEKTRNMNGLYLAASINYQQIPIPVKETNKLIEFHPKNMEEFWLSQCIIHQVYSHYSKRGYEFDLRNELNSEADEYLNTLSNVIYDDRYIQDYVRTIFTGIAPQNLNDNRPERANIEIINSVNPDAYVLPNGVLIISTGLLSVLDSEEELTAILASEVSHFVLDHQLRNVSDDVKRMKRAKNWNLALTTAAAGADIAYIVKDENYVPGSWYDITFISDIMSDIAVNRFGMGYSKKQVQAADDIAVEFLKFTGIDSGALSSAFNKIKRYYELKKDTYALSADGPYGNIYRRLAKLNSTPTQFSSRAYQIKMARVNSMNALIHEKNKNYESAILMVKKNIDNGLADEDDVIMFIRSDMNLTNSPESNQGNLDRLRDLKNKALTPNLTIFKLEILLLMRMDKENEVMAAVDEYTELLEQFKNNSRTDTELIWAQNELKWANRMYQDVTQQ